MLNYNITIGIISGKRDAKNLVPIYIFIYQGRRLLMKESLQQKIPTEFWDNKSKRVNKKYPNAFLINLLIEKRIAEYTTKILEEKIIKDDVSIKEVLIRDKIKETNFFDFAEKQIIEKDYADETRRNYRVYVDKVKGFKPNLKLRDMDFKFLQEYEAYLRIELKNKPNTIWGNFKFLNTIMNDAVKMKVLKESPFDHYERAKYRQTERTFLTSEEVFRIEEFINETSDETLKGVGLYFLLMCFSGLRFSDVIRLKAEKHIINGERIVIETQKTKQIANIYINDKIRQLLNYTLVNQPGCGQSDFNRKLKLIAAHVGITKKISSHVGRHSFGALLVEAGVTEKVAQGLLAHGSASSTKIYYHLQVTSQDEAMKKFDKK